MHHIFDNEAENKI